MTPAEDLQITINSLTHFNVPNEVIKNMLDNLNKVVNDVKQPVSERLTPAHGTKKAINLRCPKCQTYSAHDKRSSTLLSSTKSVFTGDLKQFDNEPGYIWVEMHKCKCGFVYYIENGC